MVTDLWSVIFWYLILGMFFSLFMLTHSEMKFRLFALKQAFYQETYQSNKRKNLEDQTPEEHIPSAVNLIILISFVFCWPNMVAMFFRK